MWKLVEGDKEKIWKWGKIQKCVLNFAMISHYLFMHIATCMDYGKKKLSKILLTEAVDLNKNQFWIGL